MCNEKMASMVLIMADDLPSEKILMNFFEKHSMPLFRNKDVCAQLNALEKRFKICYILCIRKPM